MQGTALEERRATFNGNETAHFIVLSGPGLGDVYELNGDALVFGSDVFAADVVVRDANVGERQAAVFRDPRLDGYVVEDLAGGTFVNQESVDGGRVLRNGDRLFLGESILEFSYGDPVKARFHEEVSWMIHHDHLTGLLAKDRFEEEFRGSLEIAGSGGRHLSILMADIDNLKEINDEHGHLLGEFIVGEVGRIIDRLHGTDGRYATRFGGDEYQTVLPGLSKSAALKVARDLRRAVEEHSFERDGVVTNPTLSIGVATFPENGRSSEDLTYAADRALYRAKNSGGDTVVVADSRESGE